MNGSCESTVHVVIPVLRLEYEYYDETDAPGDTVTGDSVATGGSGGAEDVTMYPSVTVKRDGKTYVKFRPKTTKIPEYKGKLGKG